jgi:hypothetical protein
MGSTFFGPPGPATPDKCSTTLLLEIFTSMTLEKNAFSFYDFFLTYLYDPKTKFSFPKTKFSFFYSLPSVFGT